MPDMGSPSTKAKKCLATTISRRLRKKGLSQTAGAKEMGISQSRVARIVSGDVDDMSLGTILDGAVAIGMTAKLSMWDTEEGDRPRLVFADVSGRPFRVRRTKPAEHITATDQEALMQLLAEEKRRNLKLDADLRLCEAQLRSAGGPVTALLLERAEEWASAWGSGDTQAISNAADALQEAVQAMRDAQDDEDDDVLDGE